MAPTDGSRAPERLTEGEDHFYVRSLSQDGAKLVLAQSIGSNEHDRLFLLDRESRWLTPLTPLQSESYFFGGALTEDGGAVVYTADFENGAPAQGSGIQRLDLATSATQVLARSKNVCDIAPEISPDGRLVLYGSCDASASGNQMRVVGIDGSGRSRGAECRRPVQDPGDGRLMAKWLDVETGLEQLFTLPEASLLPIAQLPGGDWLCERYSSGARLP